MPVLYEILSKLISVTNYKIYFSKVFQLLLSITLDKWPKIQNTFNESNLKNIIHSGVIASQSVSQSMNIRLINKGNKHISRLGIGTLTVTVQFKVNKKKH